MPNINPKGAGDNFYPQYNVSKPEPVGAIAIVKGRLYTKGGSIPTGNQLVIPSAATGFNNGIYQATRDIATAGTAGENSVDCFGAKSRIGLAAKTANMHAGQKVKYDYINNNVELWTGTTAGITASEIHNAVGRIYKIYSKDDITTEKDVTAAGDIVIVELGDAF